jgi:hypothetical protein
VAQGEITPFFGKDVNGCKKSLTFQNGFYRMELDRDDELFMFLTITILASKVFRGVNLPKACCLDPLCLILGALLFLRRGEKR